MQRIASCCLCAYLASALASRLAHDAFMAAFAAAAVGALIILGAFAFIRLPERRMIMRATGYVCAVSGSALASLSKLTDLGTPGVRAIGHLAFSLLLAVAVALLVAARAERELRETVPAYVAQFLATVATVFVTGTDFLFALGVSVAALAVIARYGYGDDNLMGESTNDGH